MLYSKRRKNLGGGLRKRSTRKSNRKNSSNTLRIQGGRPKWLDRLFNTEKYQQQQEQQQEQEQEQNTILETLNPLFEEAHIVIYHPDAINGRIDNKYLYQKLWPLYYSLLLFSTKIDRIDKIAEWKWYDLYRSYKLSLNEFEKRNEISSNDNIFLNNEELQISAIKMFLFYIHH